MRRRNQASRLQRRYLAGAKKKSKMPWIIAGVLLFLLLGGGALAGVFFFVVKPKLDEMAADRNPNRPVENTNASTPTPASTVEATLRRRPKTLLCRPPETVQFVNSKDKLDGKLAEHYFDFSFLLSKDVGCVIRRRALPARPTS